MRLSENKQKFPDFGTFFRHHISDSDYQSITSATGDVCKKMLIFAPCLSGKNATGLAQRVLL
jgi:hypothetical protein